MATAYGVDPTWAATTDAGRTHIARLGIIQNGLVFNLDAGSSISYPRTGTTWTDLSTNATTGTLTNGPTFNGSVGGNIVIDGSDDYVIFSTANFPSGNSPFTLQLYVRNTSGNNQSIIGYGRDQVGGNTCPVMYFNSTNKISLSFGSNTGLIEGTTTTTNGVWYNACITYNSTQLRVYVNGVLENTVSYTAGNAILDNAVNGSNGALGCLFSGFGNVGSGGTKRYGTFNGSIASVLVYNRALLDAEVARNFNATRRRYGI